MVNHDRGKWGWDKRKDREVKDLSYRSGEGTRPCTPVQGFGADEGGNRRKLELKQKSPLPAMLLLTEFV